MYHRYNRTVLLYNMGSDPNAPVYEWPLDCGSPGREVWYALVTSRDGTVAFWYHIELLSTNRGWQGGQSWVTMTRRNEHANSQFISQPIDIDELDSDSSPFRLKTATQELRSDGITGTVPPTDGRGSPETSASASWDLDWASDSYTFTPLRSKRLTDLGARLFESGKHWSCNQSVRMTGQVTVGDETITFKNAPGHQGHTMSAVTPDKMSWVHCNDFDTSQSSVDQASLEALQYGNMLSLCLRFDGDVYVFNRLHHVLPFTPLGNATVRNDVGEWSFRTGGRKPTVRVRVVTKNDNWQTATQCLPNEARRYTAHHPFAHVLVKYAGENQNLRLTSDSGRAEWIRTSPPVPGSYNPNWTIINNY